MPANNGRWNSSTLTQRCTFSEKGQWIPHSQTGWPTNHPTQCVSAPVCLYNTPYGYWKTHITYPIAGACHHWGAPVCLCNTTYGYWWTHITYSIAGACHHWGAPVCLCNTTYGYWKTHITYPIAGACFTLWGAQRDYCLLYTDINQPFIHQLKSQVIELEAKEILSSWKLLCTGDRRGLVQTAPHGLSSGVTQGTVCAAKEIY